MDFLEANKEAIERDVEPLKLPVSVETHRRSPRPPQRGAEHLVRLVARETVDELGEVGNPVCSGEEDVHRQPHAEPLGELGQAAAQLAGCRRHRLRASRLEELFAAETHHRGSGRLRPPGERRLEATRADAPNQPAPPPGVGGELAPGLEQDGVVRVPDVDARGGADCVAMEHFARQQLGFEPRVHDQRRLRASVGSEHHHHRQAAKRVNLGDVATWELDEGRPPIGGRVG